MCGRGLPPANQRWCIAWCALPPLLALSLWVAAGKSVSRGLTTAGAMIANHTPAAKALLAEVGRASAVLDTGAKKDQLVFLSSQHTGVEERCDRAYVLGRPQVLTACCARHHGVNPCGLRALPPVCCVAQVPCRGPGGGGPPACRRNRGGRVSAHGCCH